MVWYFHLFQNFPQFIVIHTVKGFSIVNKAEIDVFLELSCFFNNPMDVGNLISGSSAFLKTSLNIWKVTVHVLLKPGLAQKHGGCNGSEVWPRGATPRPRQGAVVALYWSSCEEISLVQGERNPSKTVGAERGHGRADRLTIITEN